MIADLIHGLVERYGLAAVFVGCLAEGETAAILGGFLAHQRLYAVWQVYAAVAAGAFLGDTGLFLAGRHLAGIAAVRSLTRKPVFSTAMRRVADHPDAFVLTNRFVYGLRAVGGLAAGVSGIGVPRFVMLNAISSALWAALFVGFGYAFGLGAEAVVGAALVRHERLLGIVAIVLAGLAGGWAATRALSRRAGARLRNPAGSGSGEALPQDGAPDGGGHDRGDQHRQ